MVKGERIKPARRARLVGVGSRRARDYPLDAPVISIGSAPTNSIVLEGPQVAQYHAEVRTPRGKSIIRDLGSPAGTLLNDNRVSTPVQIEDGDEIQIGAHRLRFEKSAPERTTTIRAVLLLLGLAATGFATYLFVSNWTMIEQASDYAERATPTPMSIALLATPTAMPVSIARLKEIPSPTASTSRNARASSSGTASPIPLSGSANRTTAHVRRIPVSEPPASPEAVLTTPLATRYAKPSTLAAANLSPTIAAGWPTPVPIHPPSAALDWLGALNAYRAMVHLGPVTADSKLGAGTLAHAKYLVRNFGAQIAKGRSPGAEMHNENLANPYYTAEGLEAAHQGDVDSVIEYPGHRVLPSWAIDSWMAGPFHRANILNPDLQRVGYGESCQRNVCVSVLNTIGGIDRIPPSGTIYGQPVEFPAPASTTNLIAVSGEWPSPLSVCHGYSFPAGSPITVQIGYYADARLSDFSLVTTSGHSAGTAQDVCGFDAMNYTNPVRTEQDLVRSILHGFGEVVIVPRRPLQRGTSYRVAITINGKRYTWPFSTAP
jgi:uncharacterized protein YkwD